MDFINETIIWLENNWGTAVFGTLSLGTVATTLYVLAKVWITNKLQGTKYEGMWNQSQKAIKDLKTLYDLEKAKNADATVQNVFMQASQTVLMDAIIKMALSSKLDTDDKASIVANVERLKLMAPQEILDSTKEKAETAVLNVSAELNENPAQTVVNIANTVTTLLDKYTTKKE
jgi:hypothetical protein